MKTYTICATHNQTTIVGPGTELSELECQVCVAIQDGLLQAPAPTDPEELFIANITHHDGGNCCCGTCEPDFCYQCGHYEQFCTCWNGVTIFSPNYCNHRPGDESFTCGNRHYDTSVTCKHPECLHPVIPF